MQPTLINGVFAMLTCAALAGLIFYCIGLRTGKAAGYELGRQSAATYWRKIIDNLRNQLNQARDLLDARTRELATLRQCIEQETADNNATVTQLRTALQAERDRQLTHDDWLILKLAAKQLGIAAQQHSRSGSTKTNNAATARARINTLAERVKPTHVAPAAIPEQSADAQLLDWLEDNGQLNGTCEGMAIEFPITTHPEGYPSIRALLRAAIEQQVQCTDRPASSAWERVDEHQAGPSMCL